MEHITVSELTANAASSIPYVGSKPWDGLPFLSYMEREGWSEDQLVGLDNQHPRTESEILDFLQTWLFFGLLAESCGLMGHRAYFVRLTGDGTAIISTTNLRAVYRREKKRRLQESEADFERWQENIVNCLQEAHSVLAKLTISYVSYLASPVIFGIAALCDFLKKTIPIDDLRRQCSTVTEGATQFIQDSMKARGWCPTDIERLSSGLDFASLYLVAAQRVPDPDKSHSACGSRKCLAYDTDPKCYKRLHDAMCDRTSCTDLFADSDHLRAALLSDSPALVKYARVNDSVFEIQILRSEPTIRYVAVSHVWSDGFGNPENNSMYSCQFRQKAQYVSSLTGSDITDIPFWIDTLCCPVRPREMRNLAISMMRETYSNADKVLVLNSHFLNRKKPALSLEVLPLVISSSWTRRLWTLQEGVLAKELVFQFQDESVDLETSIAKTQRELQRFLEPESFEYVALLNMATQLHHLWKDRDQTVSKKLLRCLHSELQWRSTSVPSDESLCISALLGFPLRDIVSVDIANRKMQLWKLIQRPPSIILFWSGERLKIPGFSWAPESLLDTPSSYFLEARSPSMTAPSLLNDADIATVVTNEGLVLSSDGLNLGNWTVGISKGFFANPIIGPLLWVTRQRHARSGDAYNVIRPHNINHQSDGQIKQLSLLLQKPVAHVLNPSQRGAVSALLLSHYKPEVGGIINATIEDVCTIFPAYFLTAAQKEVIDETWKNCIEALQSADKGAVQLAVAASVTTPLVNIGDCYSETYGPALPRVEEAQSDCEYFYVSRDACGLPKIEFDGALWWTECSRVSIGHEWCLA